MLNEIMEKEGVEPAAYEVGFLLRAEGELAGIKKSLLQYALEITLEGPLKTLKLAYEIEKMGQAYFGFFEVKGLPGQIVQLEKDFRMNPAILRFLVLRITRVKQQRERREDEAQMRPSRPRETRAVAVVGSEVREEQKTLSNEALEKKIEEILQ